MWFMWFRPEILSQEYPYLLDVYKQNIGAWDSGPESMPHSIPNAVAVEPQGNKCSLIIRRPP